jgi:hypothetical protein
VSLGPLDDDAMATLIDGLVADVAPATRITLIERAEGVPLSAVETVRALIDRELVIKRGARYVTADNAALDLDAIGVPASLRAVVAARLDDLGSNEKRVVADAAVLGLTFARDGLLALGSSSSDRRPRSSKVRSRSCAAGRSSPCGPTGSAPNVASTGSCSPSCARSPTPPCPAANARPAIWGTS